MTLGLLLSAIISAAKPAVWLLAVIAPIALALSWDRVMFPATRVVRVESCRRYRFAMETVDRARVVMSSRAISGWFPFVVREEEVVDCRYVSSHGGFWDWFALRGWYEVESNTQLPAHIGSAIDDYLGTHDVPEHPPGPRNFWIAASVPLIGQDGFQHAYEIADMPGSLPFPDYSVQRVMAESREEAIATAHRSIAQDFPRPICRQCLKPGDIGATGCPDCDGGT